LASGTVDEAVRPDPLMEDSCSCKYTTD